MITRVSEFVEEIVQYIKKLEDLGYAYRSNGSVYFNVNVSENHKNNHFFRNTMMVRSIRTQN